MLTQYLSAFSNKYRKYGTVPNTIDIVKFLAIVTMVVDHLGHYFFPDNLWLRAVGRLSLPIWTFLAGYSKPAKFNYDIVVLCALVLLARTAMLMPVLPINILATICICRVYADFLRHNNKFEKWGVVNLIVVFVTLLVWFPVSGILFEYGTLAFMFTICGVMQRSQPGSVNTTIAFAITTISFIYIEYFDFEFSVPQFIAMMVGVVFVMHLLSAFKMQQITYFQKYQAVERVIIFLSRNSLYFYFLHIILFAILSKIIFPHKYMVFKWLLV